MESQFPGYDLPTDHANALRSTLEQLPWWSPDPLTFPKLIEGKTTKPFATILEQSLSSEPHFLDRSFFDQFTFLVVALAAIGPIVNRSYVEDSTGEAKEEASLIASCTTVAGHWDSEITRLLQQVTPPTEDPKTPGKNPRKRKKVDLKVEPEAVRQS
jgi:hypothetical protein